MRKNIVLIMIIFFLTGCVNINSASYNEIIDEIIQSKKDIYNTYRNGYKFYLPQGLYIYNTKEYNEEIRSNDVKYYLYIDIISYLKKNDITYNINTETFYSNEINCDDKKGYIEINKGINEYLVEIVYNYAKIEMIVNEENLKKAISNAIIILSSISYNDDILANINEENVLSYNEDNIDIFKIKSKGNNNFLKIIEDFEEEETEDELEEDLMTIEDVTK